MFVDVGDPICKSIVALRGGIDAVPIQTDLETDYASRAAAAMHACGHDSHAAMAWGALAILIDPYKAAPLQKSIPAVCVIFQPEEETIRGGLHMIDAGAVEHVSAAAVLHVAQPDQWEPYAIGYAARYGTTNDWVDHNPVKKCPKRSWQRGRSALPSALAFRPRSKLIVAER